MAYGMWRTRWRVGARQEERMCFFRPEGGSLIRGRQYVIRAGGDQAAPIPPCTPYTVLPTPAAQMFVCSRQIAGWLKDTHRYGTNILRLAHPLHRDAITASYTAGKRQWATRSAWRAG